MTSRRRSHWRTGSPSCRRDLSRSRESEAFFTACGFARVSQFESLVEAPAVLRRVPGADRPRVPRIGVVTTTGGGAAVMVDQLALRGLTVVGPSPELVARMAEAGADVPHSLIADLGLAGARHDIVTNALRLMQDSGEFDLIVFVIGSSARTNPELAVHAIAARGDHPVPLVAFALPEAAASAELLHAAGVPASRTPESCADVIEAAFARRAATIGRHLITQADVQAAPAMLDEHASAAVLAEQGVPFEPAVTLAVDSLEGLVDLPFGYPVVVKALSDRLPHKSDAGGVVLNVRDDEGLRAAARTVVSNVAAHDPTLVVDRVLVQRMVETGVVEALVGYRVSPDVGPLVVLSTGGVLAEVFADSAARLAPVTYETALEMIDEVRGLSVLNGHRGAPAGDRDALARVIVSMSSLAVAEPDVCEAEANPVSVGPSGAGAVALDALVGYRTAPLLRIPAS